MPRTPVYPTSPLPEAHSFGRHEGGGLLQSALDGASTATPDTPMQALMETPPFRDPLLSKQELLPAMDAVVLALNVLDDRERWIVMARIWRQRSVRQVATELALSKTHCDRIYKGALRKLEVEIEGCGGDLVIAGVLGKVEL